MWECKICNYSTKYSTHYKKHILTKTHIILCEKIEKRQEKSIFKNDNIINSINIELIKIRKNQEEIKNNQYLSYNKLNKNQEKLLNSQEKTINTINKINKNVKKITDYIDFLNKNCLEADPINILTDVEIDNILELSTYKKYKFEEYIIENIKNNNLFIKIGDSIIEKYLKNDEELKKQQIWTSDITRLIYLILQMSGTEKNWVRDKKGELFSKMITIPIINRINIILKKYSVYLLNTFDNVNEYNIKNQIILEKIQITKNFTSNIYIDKLKLSLLKYLSYKFSISAKIEAINNN